jgi:hypothetical protein
MGIYSVSATVRSTDVVLDICGSDLYGLPVSSIINALNHTVNVGGNVSGNYEYRSCDSNSAQIILSDIPMMVGDIRIHILIQSAIDNGVYFSWPIQINHSADTNNTDDRYE